MTKSTGVLCVKHGGTYDGYDDYWYCDACARSGINACSCGSPARYFGEALAQSVSCEACDECVLYIGTQVDIREAWNKGERGIIV